MLFQSLFCWIGHLDRTTETAKKAVERFNPCFAGLVIWTESDSAFSTTPKLFQSLFCWIGHLDIYTVQAYPPCSRVSILVLLDWSFGRDRRNQTDTAQDSFNPCFAGLVIWTRLWLIDPLDSMVSILVLLDWSFGQPRFSTFYAWIS